MNKIKLSFLLVVSSFMLFSCGGGETTNDGTDNEQNANAPAPAPTEPPSSSSAEATDGEVVELSLEGNDQMQFNKKELRVKAGQTVRLTLIHVGTMPKNAMGHNFVLLNQGVDLAAFGQAAAAAMENDYIPESEVDNVIAHTKLLGGGESDTIEFTAPAEGSYEFLCSFPGHYALMKGVFIVE
ncbi:MAG: azurin [Anditalea sp.]